MTRITDSVNGVVFRAEMACIEVPAGSNTTPDLDLVANSASLAEDVEYDASGTPTVLIDANGSWVKGEFRGSVDGSDFSALPDAYLYLANGSGANSGGTFSAGKYVIRLYGAAF
jgi:hypothetical protein